jgi:tripartite-type tricarboxylate transporter receptor subunit TctC
MNPNLKCLVALSVIGIGLLSAASVRAQDNYPWKPIQLVVTTAAGGALDLVARTVADRLSVSMHQPIIIENQPAGNGAVAAGQFAKATPDGHTLMMVVDSTVSYFPHFFRYLTYGPFRDFAPVSVVTRLPLVLISNSAVQATNLQELIALAKANPGKLNYASTGVGTQLHIGMEMFKLMTKTDIVHVPYRATTAAMADLMGGRIDLALIGLSSAKAQVESGKLRAYAIAAPQRSPLMPDVPSADEVGLPGYEVRFRAGEDAARRDRPPVTRDQESLDRSEIHCGARAARHADRRLVARRDGAGDARRLQEMGGRDPEDRHHDQSIAGRRVRES